MSDVMTRINLPKSKSNCSGFMDYGRKSPSEMIEILRGIARRDKEKAEEILSAPNSAFQVDVVLGVCAQHLLKEIQHSDRN